MCPQGGGDGMIATMGGRWGGWGLYLLKGKPVFNYNMLILAQYRWEGRMRSRRASTRSCSTTPMTAPASPRAARGVLKVDGKVVATGKQANSIAFLQVADETFDVGVDTRTGVNDKDYQVPFAFNGKIDKLTVKLGPTQLTEVDRKIMHTGIIKAKD